MIGISEMQYGGMLTTALLALTLVLLVPRRAIRNTVFGRARWMMAAGLALISIQFLLQYIFGFRQMGITQAVFWNLLFFMPCTASINLAVLYIQQKGNINIQDWLVGGVMYLLTLLLLVGTTIADGIPFAEESGPLRIAEYVGSSMFMLMQGHYYVLLYRGYRRMRHAVDEYYDRERNDLLGWMGRSVIMLAVLALFVPIVIFLEGWPLTLYGSAFFFTIYYCASSFHSYGISQDVQRVEEAEESQESDETEPTMSDDDRLRVEQAAQKWVAAGYYRQPNQTLTTVANDMNVQRYMLKAWLQASEHKKLSNWLNLLRTEEAQRIMTEHPDWGLDAVATHCGLSLSSFHRIFHKLTGVTPAKFQKQQS